MSRDHGMQFAPAKGINTSASAEADKPGGNLLQQADRRGKSSYE